jgi:hypothetical protein
MRQSWLRQMLSIVPPRHWSDRWQIDPAACIAAASGDFATLIVSAWADAAERHNDVAWMTALLLSPAEGAAARLSLIEHLPAAAQATVLPTLMHSAKLDTSGLARMVGALRMELSGEPLEAVLMGVEAQRKNLGIGYHYALPAILDPLAFRVPPRMYDALAQRWSGDEANQKSFDAFFQTLQFRKDIQTEFAQ